MTMNTQTKILRKPEVIRITGLSNTSIHEQTNSGLFPSGFNLSARAIGYLESEISALITARAAGYNDEQIRQLVKALIAKRTTDADALMSFLAA